MDLFASDGTGAGTQLLKEISITFSANPTMFTKVGDKVFFFAQQPSSISTASLWVTDGTSNGTIKVKDNVGYSMIELDGKLFFDGYENNGNYELYITDVTSLSITIIKQFGNPASPIQNLASFKNKLYFQCNDGSNLTGFELWVSDGTTAGTTMLKDIEPGPVGSFPRGFKS